MKKIIMPTSFAFWHFSGPSASITHYHISCKVYPTAYFSLYIILQSGLESPSSRRVSLPAWSTGGHPRPLLQTVANVGLIYSQRLYVLCVLTSFYLVLI